MSDKSVAPIIIQGSVAPAFRGDQTLADTFSCHSCGHLLIENYDSECYVCVGIQCFSCQAVSVTPDLPIGEVFAASTASLGREGRFRIESTVNVPSGSILTTDEAIEREIRSTAPSQSSSPLVLTLEGLDKIIETYENLTNQNFDHQLQIMSRKSSQYIKKFPLVWSICHLKNCLHTEVLDMMNPKTSTAMLWIHEFCHVIGIWQRHPRFPAIALQFGLPGQFLHTSALLLIASYLYSAGNRIGITVDEEPNGPNPDLYIRGVGGRRLFLEIKTPETLRWPIESITPEKLEKAVKRCIQKSSAQINRNRPGVLVICSSLIALHFPESFKQAIQRGVASEGRGRKGLDAVMCLSPLGSSVSGDPVHGPRYDASYRVDVATNNHSDGKNFLRTY